MVARQKKKEERRSEKSMQKEGGVEEAGVEDELEERTKRKMQKGPGSSSGMQPPAGEEEPLKTHSEDVEMSSARGPKRSGEDIEELEAGSKAGVEAVRSRWADLEDSEEDEDFIWEKHILGEKDGKAVRQISQIVVGTAEALEKAQEVLEEAMRDLEQAWDDVHFRVLHLKKVREGRLEEITFMKQKMIWNEADETECWVTTGKKPVRVKWVDTNKGTEEEPVIRCRLVARDFRTNGEKDREEFFVATPPLEMKRMLISRTASRRKDGRFKKMLFVDAKKLHLNPKCEQNVFPAEAGAAKGKCGKLNFWL